MEEEKPITIEELNPTFLFSWKGVRDDGEEEYHNHDFLAFIFILSGKGTYRIEGTECDIREGDLLILNPGVWHQSLMDEEAAEPTTEFFVGFSDIQIPGYPYNYLPVPGEAHLIHTTGELKHRLTKLCAAIETENKVCKEGRYFMLKAYLMEMILLVIREQCETIEGPGGYAFESVNKKYVVENIIGYFEKNYSEKISLDRIAENMYLSPFYISKIFKSETGDTPIRYLINIRLAKAKELLENESESSIQEIACRVGYEDAYHFSKLFKKRYGMSPSQVRNKTNL